MLSNSKPTAIMSNESESTELNTELETELDGLKLEDHKFELKDQLGEGSQRTNIDLINDLPKKFEFGDESESSSLYVIVNYNELEKAKNEKEMLESVVKCGTVYSMSLEQRMSVYRQQKKENGKDLKMLEVETLKKCDTETYGIHFAMYIVVLEYAVHCLTPYLTNLKSKPGFGPSTTFFHWFAKNLLDEINHKFDILKKIRQKIIDALRHKNYVTGSEKAKCNRCGNEYSNKYYVKNDHQTNGRCKIDKNYFKQLKTTFNKQESNKQNRGENMNFSVNEFNKIVNEFLNAFKEKSLKEIILLLLQSVDGKLTTAYTITIGDEKKSPKDIIDGVENGRIKIVNVSEVDRFGKVLKIKFNLICEPWPEFVSLN